MKKSRLVVIIAALILIVASFSVVSHANTDTASVLLGELSGVCPTLSEDGGSIVLPTVSDENYEVLLYGTSNESVIGLDGSVYTPLVDTEVEIMYKVVNKSDNTDFAVSSVADCIMTVSGSYTEADNDNAEPNVLPKLREWKGLTGTVSITKDSKVCYSDSSVEKTADLIAEYISDITGFSILAFFTDSASAGDIILAVSDESELGSEGYRISLEDSILISAPTEKGLLYGGTTIAQMLSLYKNYALPRGHVRDYPQVAIRSIMLDVARVYVPLDYVEEITKYMAYFKLNEIRLHINDNGGEQDYAFRLESKLYPEINSNLPSDKVYTQEAYRTFQKNALDYGVTVITEIDTPAHAGFVKLYDESLMLDKSHIDLSDDKYDRSIAFVQSLISEYIDGEDPVIAANRVHVGMDEYGSNRSAFLRYMNDMTDFMVEKGITPAVWGAIKAADVSSGENLPHPDSIIHCWSGSEASYPDVINQGYNVINNSCLSLYVVPGGFSNSFPDRLNLKSLYESFDVNKIGGYVISMAHPQLLGIEAALWNDKDGGMSKYDLFSRMSEQIALVSEKGWFGARPSDIDGESFEARFRALEYMSPLVNPSRHVDTGDTDVVIDTDFSSEDGFTLNGGASLSEENGRSVLVLDGNGYISLPYKSVGYPWTVKLSFNYSSETAESATLFAGEEGNLYLNYNGSGCIAYERQGRLYILDYELEKDIWHDLVIVCDGNACRLYKHNVQVAEGKYYNKNNDNMRSSTLVLPTEKIGEGVVGMLGELTILNKAIDHNKITGFDIIGYGNVALNKDVTLSGIESGVSCMPGMAVDGIESGTENRISLNRVDDAWFTVDLGKVCNVEYIDIIWQKRPNKYSVLVSLDGIEWTNIYENLECAGGSSGTDRINAEEGTKARYVKYQQIERFANASGYKYSGAFFEIKVIGYSLWNYYNVALNKDVTLSGIESGVSCTPEMAVDGIESGTENRISLNRIDNAWFTVDLGRVYAIDCIDIIWQKRPNKYSMLVSEDGVVWTEIYENLECDGGSSGTDRIEAENGVKARYVKYQQIEKFANASGYKYSGAFFEVKVFGYSLSNYDNIALNKDVTLSGKEWGVSCTPEMAVDGVSEIISSNRISLNKDDDAWFTVDLGKVYNIDLIEMFWYKRPNKYSMLVSKDGVEWTSVYENLECEGASSGIDQIPIVGGTEARYVKYQQIERFTSGNYQYSGNFTEIKVFGEIWDNSTVFSKALGIIETTDITDENSAFIAKFKQSYDLFEYLVENGTKENFALALRALSIEIEKFEAGDYTVTDLDVSGLISELKNKRSKDYYEEASYNSYELAYALAISVAIDSSIDAEGIELTAENLTNAANKLVPTAIANLNFKPKTSITLGSELVYRVYVPASIYLTSFTLDGIEYNALADFENAVTLDDGELYYLVCISLGAKEAARNIALEVNLTVDAQDYTGRYTLSVPKYVKALLADSAVTETEKTLALDVLAYIKAAYTYFGTDDAEQMAKIDTILGEYASEPTIEGSSAADTTGFKSATLVLSGKPSIRFYLADGATASEYKFYINGKKIKTVISEDGTYIDTDVYAYELSETVTCTINGKTAGSFHINCYYSYVSGTGEKDYKGEDKETLTTLVECFWKYLQSARDYRNSVISAE